jgi:hypothetical protein
MLVRDLIDHLMYEDQDAFVFIARDGYSREVNLIEPSQTFCAIELSDPRSKWQRCWATKCSRWKVQGVLLA